MGISASGLGIGSYQFRDFAGLTQFRALFSTERADSDEGFPIVSWCPSGLSGHRYGQQQAYTSY